MIEGWYGETQNLASPLSLVSVVNVVYFALNY